MEYDYSLNFLLYLSEAHDVELPIFSSDFYSAVKGATAFVARSVEEWIYGGKNVSSPVDRNSRELKKETFLKKGEPNAFLDFNHNLEEDVDIAVNNDFSKEMKERLYSMAEVSEHYTEDDCWVVIRDNVYDITRFLPMHPAGVDIILEAAGTDATISFEDSGHGPHVYELLQKYRIGHLVEEERLEGPISSSCDSFCSC